MAGRPGVAAYTRNATTGALTAIAGKDGCTTYYETLDDVLRLQAEREVRAARLGAPGRQARLRGDRRERGRDDVGPQPRHGRVDAAQPRGRLHRDAVLRVRYFHACAPARHLAGAWFAIGSPDGRHLYAGSL